MNYDVAITADAEAAARTHLLQHFEKGHAQEDLCFALWRLSTGRTRQTALISEVVLPSPDDRTLHHNVSFEPRYLARAMRLACAKDCGLALMHSHPTDGWQSMSAADVVAERDILAYAAGATGLPFLGLTCGTDGYWSARFWRREGSAMTHVWCTKTRVLTPTRYRLFFNDRLAPPSPRRQILKRTFDTWGRTAQSDIARLHVGIVGLGSVGCIVAESMARIGVSQVTLIDPDHVEVHNLDRLLFASERDIGRSKVAMAARAMRRHATSGAFSVAPLSLPIQDTLAYRSALDCDIIFSCVDRPVARDVLNYISQAHLIPVIDAGIAVDIVQAPHRLRFAHWRAHLATPYHQCLRCNRQYTSSMVVVELDGSLDDPSYVANLPPGAGSGNENVFPFSLAAAAMQVNLFIRYLISEEWWPLVKQQDYQFLTGKIRIVNEECHPHCSFRPRRAQGDAESPPYLVTTPRAGRWGRLCDLFRRLGGIGSSNA